MRVFKNFIIGFLIGAMAALAVILAFDSPSDASDLGLMDLNELSVDYRNYAMIKEGQKDLLLYPESPKEGLNLNIKTDLLSIFGWDSTIESLTTDSQYRGIGLQTALYARLTQTLDIGYLHHSQHLIDRDSATVPHFPSEDCLTLKLYLFRAKPGRDSLF